MRQLHTGTLKATNPQTMARESMSYLMQYTDIYAKAKPVPQDSTIPHTYKKHR